MILRFFLILIILGLLTALGYLVYEYGGLFDTPINSDGPTDASTDRPSTSDGDAETDRTAETGEGEPNPDRHTVIDENNLPELNTPLTDLPAVWHHPDTGMIFRLVQAGEFFRGSNASYNDKNETPLQVVWVSSFYILETEVTRGDYQAFIDAGGYDRSEASESSQKQIWELGTYDLLQARQWEWPNGWANFSASDDVPVVGISWAEARAFCRWLGGGLPTEVQWEKAARGAEDAREYPWGISEQDEVRYNWRDVDPSANDDTPGNNRGYYDQWANHSPVRFYGSGSNDGRSPYGIYSMAGNVMEYVEDGYEPDFFATLTPAQLVDPVNLPTSSRLGLVVAKGGSYMDAPHECRIPWRRGVPVGERNELKGFRVAFTVDQVRAADPGFGR